MTAFIENPRRSPRISIPCGARIALRSGSFSASFTADVGPGGCGVVAASSRLEPGERIFVEIDFEGSRHLLSGRVAWSSSSPPWRGGVAFDAASLRAAASLFARIASAHPELADEGRTIDRIPEDAILARTPVPGTLKAVPREAEILLAVGDGLEARALPERLGSEWDGCANALFALLQRRVLEAREPASPSGPAQP